MKRRAGRGARLARAGVGGLFLVGAGVHVGLVSADAEIYRHFADTSPLGGVRSAWQDVFMASPGAWGLMLAAGELAIGVLVLASERTARLGFFGAVAFHVALMLFGYGFWLWSIPMLALLVFLIREHGASLERPRV